MIVAISLELLQILKLTLKKFWERAGKGSRGRKGGEMPNPQDKLHADIQRFLEVYSVLSPEGKAQFEAQMAGATKNQDERTRKLYQVLLQAAKDGKEIEEAIQEMHKVNG